MYVVDGSPEGELSHIGDTEESALCYEQSGAEYPIQTRSLTL